MAGLAGDGDEDEPAGFEGAGVAVEDPAGFAEVEGEDEPAGLAAVVVLVVAVDADHLFPPVSRYVLQLLCSASPSAFRSMQRPFLPFPPPPLPPTLNLLPRHFRQGELTSDISRLHQQPTDPDGSDESINKIIHRWRDLLSAWKQLRILRLKFDSSILSFNEEFFSSGVSERWDLEIKAFERALVATGIASAVGEITSQCLEELKFWILDLTRQQMIAESPMFMLEKGRNSLQGGLAYSCLVPHLWEHVQNREQR